MALTELIPLLTAIDVETQIVTVDEAGLFVWIEFSVGGMSCRQDDERRR